jgi:hypothetical protein
MLFTEVDAIRAALPNAVNLLASAVRPGDGAGKWMEGMAWRSELCPTYQGYNPCTELEEGPEPGEDGLVYHVPVAYRVKDECATLSGTFDEARVERLANAVASYVVAQELWTGALSALDPYDLPNAGAVDQVNHHLASTNAETVAAPAAGDPLAAIAELEERTREATRGQQVFIHAPVGIVGQVAQNLRRVGNELRTATDGILVGDAGYPGTGPAGTGTNWIYGTGPVAVRLGPIQTETEPRSTVNRQTNTRLVWADRMFAVTFDPCAHFAMQVT